MSAIKEIIKNYIQVDDEIKALTKQIKPLRSSKELLAVQIQEFLSSNSENPNSVLEIGKDVFKVVSTTKKSISRENFEVVIRSNTSDTIANKIIEDATEEKDVKYLKRITKK